MGESERLSIRRLTDFAQVEALYQTRLKKDFARKELRPLASLRRSWEHDAYDCYGLYDGEALLGYAFFVRLEKNDLLDYFAIAEEHRDEGLGTVFLQMLASCLADADCAVCEVEDPERAQDEETRAQRERRLRFYLRSGYRKTELTSRVFGVDYRILEAPTGSSGYRKTELTSRVFGVDYRILEAPTGKTHTADELRAIYTALYKSILPGLFFHTQFRVFSESENRNEVPK